MYARWNLDGVNLMEMPPNPALERTVRRQAHHGRALHAARRSTPSRQVDAISCSRWRTMYFELIGEVGDVEAIASGRVSAPSLDCTSGTGLGDGGSSRAPRSSVSTVIGGGKPRYVGMKPTGSGKRR